MAKKTLGPLTIPSASSSSWHYDGLVRYPFMGREMLLISLAIFLTFSARMCYHNFLVLPHNAGLMPYRFLTGWIHFLSHQRQEHQPVDHRGKQCTTLKIIEKANKLSKPGPRLCHIQLMKIYVIIKFLENILCI